jgi:hypothetical protein
LNQETRFIIDQSKIPEFWGQKAKDQVTAIVFIRKIEDLARTNHWTDTATYANVANAFKGFAREWLFATVDMLDWTDAELTWTNLNPDSRSNLRHKPMTNKSSKGFLIWPWGRTKLLENY